MTDTTVDLAVARLLGDPLRGRLLELLSREVLCTSHLVEATGATQSNVSNHLRLMREAGLVTTEPCGRYSYYALVPDALRRLSDQLAVLADAAASDLPRRPCA